MEGGGPAGGAVQVVIDPDVRAEAQRLLAEGRLKKRQIARQLGIARGTLAAIANGPRPAEVARRRRREEAAIGTGPPGKCPTCGHRNVRLPCRACWVRRLVADGRLRPCADHDPADDRALTIDLRDGDPDTYLRIRRRKEQELFGAMLADARDAAAEDPQDDVEPSDAELEALEREPGD